MYDKLIDINYYNKKNNNYNNNQINSHDNNIIVTNDYEEKWKKQRSISL